MKVQLIELGIYGHGRSSLGNDAFPKPKVLAAWHRSGRTWSPANEMTLVNVGSR